MKRSSGAAEDETPDLDSNKMRIDGLQMEIAQLRKQLERIITPSGLDSSG